MATKFFATGWSNGSDGYGLRIGKVNRDKYFKKSIKEITLSFPDKTPSTKIKITDSFWRKCTELRSREIKAWYKKKKYIDWNSGHPPKFEIEKVNASHFKIARKIRV